MATPTNIRPLIDNIDGVYVKITWDDPDSATATQARVYDETGATAQSCTTDPVARVAFVPTGSWRLQLYSPAWTLKVPFTAVAQPVPAPLTAEQKLESVLGPLATGSRIAVYPEPTVLKTVNADGSVS